MGARAVTTDLTTRIAGLASLIGQRLTEDEAAAKAATIREGRTLQVPVPNWTRCRSGDVYDEDDSPGAAVFGDDDEVIVYDEGSPSPAQADHIARHDPARVLRRVKATRELVAAIIAEPHDWIPGDEFYSCSQAVELNPVPESPGVPGSGCTDPDRAGQPCDCGRDQRVARLLGIIAGEWEGTS
jgi:hypothetical protein